jgi:SAM-dependent methyltransferase
MHIEIVNFIEKIRDKFPNNFNDANYLDIGSLDINGSNKQYFTHGNYIGCDLIVGNNVDIVCEAAKLPYPDETFHTIISTESFEHDKNWKKTLKKAVDLLKSGGLFVFSCATTGRAEHGTVINSPDDNPALYFGDYYKNLTEKDIRKVLKIENIFKEFEFSINIEHCDLYFWGIKK